MTTVYVICPDFNEPSGGTMKLYEFVDILNQNGINSFIIHHEIEFRINWFKNTTKVTYLENAKVTYDDLIIIPETYGEKIMNYFPGVRKIIYNQNSFNTFDKFSGNIQLAKHFYLHQDVVQVIVGSKNDFDVLSWLFPGIKLSRIYHGINDKLFYYNPNKSKTIAVMPRKHERNFVCLAEWLLIKDDLDGFTIEIIEDVSIEKCAEILRDALIFLSFSYEEGFGLPPAEAMACGCVVIGYHGEGGKEFFKKNLTYRIEQSNLMEYAKSIKYVVDKHLSNPLELQQISKNASEYILKKYSLTNQAKSIIKVISRFL